MYRAVFRFGSGLIASLSSRAWKPWQLFHELRFIMKEKKKIAKAATGLSIWKWVNIVGVLGGLIALIIGCVNHLNNQMTEFDRRTQRLEETTRRIDNTLVEIKDELKKTSDLLNADLSWRY
jgi:hypothetical protein